MRLTIDRESFKLFSKIVLTCTKLGEEIFFECRNDYLTLKSVNDARSLFFFTKFERKFFDDYQVPNQIECKFKAKSCVIPFKASNAMEKNINTLEFYVDKDKDGATFQMNFDTEDITIHEIGFVNTTLQVDIDEDVQFNNYLMAKVKSLFSLFSNFPNLSDYCIMTVDEDKICFETYNFKMNEVRTAFSVKNEIFLEYKINKKIRCTFVLKPMKIFLNALDKYLNCYLYFEDDNCPIHIIIRNNFIEHKFIIASIDVDLDSMNENVNSIPAPKEIHTTDLTENLKTDAHYSADNEEVMSNSQIEEMEDDSSSSSSSDQSPSYNTTKPKTSLHLKRENYTTIYSSDTEDASSISSQSNQTASEERAYKICESSWESCRNNKSPLKNSPAKSQLNNSQVPDTQIRDTQVHDTQIPDSQIRDTQVRDSQIPETRISETQIPETQIRDSQIRDSQIRDTQVRDTQVRDSQIRDSQLLFDDDPLSPGPVNCDLNDQEICSQNNKSSSSATQPKFDPEADLFGSLDETFDHRTISDLAIDPDSIIKSNPMMMEKEDQSSQFDNKMSGENSNPMPNKSTDQDTNSVSKQSSNSHSTQENDNENIKMVSINLSRIETDSSMNKEFDDSDWNFDILVDDEKADESMETEVDQSSSAYDNFYEKLPTMSTNNQQDDDKKSMFSKFMLKNRSIVP